MNERIRELAEQAGGHNNISKFRGHFLPPPPDYIDPATVDLEKFARLVAKQCAQLAMTQHHSTSPANYDEMDPYDQGCDDTASRISGLIRRTFGVE